jgi:hypothetical protein
MDDRCVKFRRGARYCFRSVLGMELQPYEASWKSDTFSRFLSKSVRMVYETCTRGVLCIYFGMGELGWFYPIHMPKGSFLVDRIYRMLVWLKPETYQPSAQGMG